MADMVNHPPHYTQGRVEAIEVIDDLCGESFGGYLLGNVAKYVLRHQHKGGTEDLRKAAWYLDRLIAWRECREGAGTDGDA